jgi:hypothetical protein
MRIFFKDVSNVIEITKQMNKYKSETYALTVTSSDAIYIASDFPLNHFFIKMGAVVNEAASEMIIDYWTGQGWEPVVNKNDYTEAFSQSGFVEFTPDRDVSWNRENTNSNGQSIVGLESVIVYDKYWIRISFTNSLDAAIELEWLGNLFSEDDDLFAEYPIFNDQTFLTAFESGKIDWEEQHVKAASLIIQDLKRSNVIIGAEQILDRSILAPASVCKVAEIIFNAFGKDYQEQLTRARDEYLRRIDLSRYVVDTNNNGIEDLVDKTYSQGWLSR